jgi:hypothetical protein
LLADATLDRPGTKVREVASNGTCLIIAKDASALSFAETLGEELAVTCVLEQSPEEIRPSAHYDLAIGQIQSVSGGLGAFDVVFNQFSTLVATGTWGEPIYDSTGRSQFDLRYCHRFSL